MLLIHLFLAYSIYVTFIMCGYVHDYFDQTIPSLACSLAYSLIHLVFAPCMQQHGHLTAISSERKEKKRDLLAERG
jgi:hypothetical protein